MVLLHIFTFVFPTLSLLWKVTQNWVAHPTDQRHSRVKHFHVCLGETFQLCVCCQCETFLCLFSLRKSLDVLSLQFFLFHCVILLQCNCLLSLQVFAVNIFGDNVALQQLQYCSSGSNCSKCVCVFVCPSVFGGVSTTFNMRVCVDFFQLSSHFLSGISNSSERVQSFDINNCSFSYVLFLN